MSSRKKKRAALANLAIANESRKTKNEVELDILSEPKPVKNFKIETIKKAGRIKKKRRPE